MSVQVLCTFFYRIIFVVVELYEFLYILDFNPLSEAWFANISHLVICFYDVLMVSFAMQKVFSLIESHSIIFAFTSFVFEVKFIKSSIRPRSLSAGEVVKQKELSYTAGGNINWYSHYGKQYGYSSKE